MTFEPEGTQEVELGRSEIDLVVQRLTQEPVTSKQIAAVVYRLPDSWAGAEAFPDRFEAACSECGTAIEPDTWEAVWGNLFCPDCAAEQDIHMD